MLRDTYVSWLAEVQGNLLVVSELNCNFSEAKLNTYAEAFEVSMKRF
jgi:hypothetical protein